MRRLFLAAAAAATMACSAAYADCAAEIEALAGGGGISKDGSHAPLGASPDVATSAGDVAAQQQGEAPAAADAMASDPRTAALDRARAAAAAGDEAGCMAAVEEARGM